MKIIHDGRKAKTTLEAWAKRPVEREARGDRHVGGGNRSRDRYLTGDGRPGRLRVMMRPDGMPVER